MTNTEKQKQRPIRHNIDLPAYDDANDEALTMSNWIEMWAMKSGKLLNLNTMQKRRYVADVGTLVPPRTFLLTKSEFEEVMRTPLPLCKNVEA